METLEVNKLTFKSQGPFRVKTVLGNGSYELQQYNEPESVIYKYNSTYLYIIPPAIFPPEPVNTMDVRF